jgi:2',3'-cyclic-nucleotide 2'-phosphodiesterase (5'-nucleotidase family)
MMWCSLPPIEYEDFIQVAHELSDILRNEEHCDLVIALTHMRIPNDEKLARELKGKIDVVLGGHDHFSVYSDAVTLQEMGKTITPSVRDCGGAFVIKSGTDFRELSAITVTLNNGRVAVHGTHPPITLTEYSQALRSDVGHCGKQGHGGVGVRVDQFHHGESKPTDWQDAHCIGCAFHHRPHAGSRHW